MLFANILKTQQVANIMKELYWTKIRSLFSLLVLAGLLLLLSSSSQVYGQTYKMYYQNGSKDNPQTFTVKDMAFNSLNNSVVVGGEYRIANTSVEAYGYTLETGMDGLEISNHAIVAPTTSSNDGFRMGGIAMDLASRTYLVGSFAPDMANMSSTTEKTITGLDYDGKLRWSQMEGSRHFADIVFDKDDNSIVALGAPDGLWPISQPVSILKLNTDGTLKSYHSVYDPAINQAVKLIDLPDNKGYVAVAIYDTAGLKAPYVIRFDQSLKRIWSHVYSNFLFEYDVQDVAYHPDGYIAVTGSSYDPVNEVKKAFLMSIDEQGRINFSYHIKALGHGDAEGFGLSHVKHDLDPAYNGFLVGGSYTPIASSTTATRHSLMFLCTLDGKISWAKDYSNFSVADFIEDETVKDVLFVEGSQSFVAAGEYKASIGNQLYHRQIWMAKASIQDGDLHDNGSCSAPITLDLAYDTLGTYRAGTDTTGGSFMNYSYPVTSLEFSRINCSYSTDQKAQNGNTSTNMTGSTDLTTSNAALEQPIQERASKLEIYDLTGRLVISTQAANQNWKAGMPPGLYVVRYLKGNKILSSEKMVLR